MAIILAGAGTGCAPPTDLKYSSNPAIYQVGATITPNLPSNQGGPALYYSVSPTLPAGLVLNPRSGAISGSPTSATSRYVVTASNVLGSTTATLSITVYAPLPVIDVQPADQAVYIGQKATFSVTASGAGPLTYQWLRNGTPIDGATAASYTFATALTDNGSAFSVQITDAFGASATSNAALLKVQDWTGFVSIAGYDRGGGATALLATGKVLIVRVSDSLLYDPATNTFTPTGGVTTIRSAPKAIPLQNGKVLVEDGTNAELYDPATGTFTAIGSLLAARGPHAAALLQSGKVLFVGGSPAGAPAAELYDPATGTFTPTGGASASFDGSLSNILLPDGKVLFAKWLSDARHPVQEGSAPGRAEAHPQGRPRAPRRRAAPRAHRWPAPACPSPRAAGASSGAGPVVTKRAARPGRTQRAPRKSAGAHPGAEPAPPSRERKRNGPEAVVNRVKAVQENPSFTPGTAPSSLRPPAE